MLASAMRRVASRSLSRVSAPAFNRSVHNMTLLQRLPSASYKAPVSYSQIRFSSVDVYGPFDPPKQLTFAQVEERVLKAIRAWDRFPEDKAPLLKLDAVFSELGFDSLDHVEIMMAVEDEFSFEIPLQDSEKLKSARDVFKYICDREDVYE